MNRFTKLPESFYLRKTETVARALLGKRLVRLVDGRVLSGVIVETEAYLGEKDPAAHTFGGRKSARNAAMYLAGGHAYVYMIYGMHMCLNVVTRGAGCPEAVLIRALEPEDGLELMLERRRVGKATQIASGPGRLCSAMDINRALNGTSLLGDELFVAEGRRVSKHSVAVSRRIGVEYAGEAADWPLRFYVEKSAHVSKAPRPRAGR